MSPLFRRGELKAALLDALALVGPANGYVIMQAIADRLGDLWQPSPGAVYPALLGLVDAGLITASEDGASRIYSLTTRGRRALVDVGGTLDEVVARVRSEPPRGRRLSRIAEEWVGALPGRDRRLSEDEERAVQQVLARAQDDIERFMTAPRTRYPSSDGGSNPAADDHEEGQP